MNFIFEVLYNGTIRAIKEYRLIRRIYLAFLIGFFVEMFIVYTIGTINTHIIVEQTYIVLVIAILTVLVVGVREYIKDAPYRASVARWRELFLEINLCGTEKIPQFLYEEDISPCVQEVAFKTLIPLSIWEKKQELLEMHINRKIISIVQAEHNNRIIKLLIELEPLPDEIGWDDDFHERGDILNIGVSYFDFIGMDLSKHPHAFIAGETGSGKSNILKCMIHQALFKGYEVVLIDFKRGVSFSEFENYVDIHYDYPDTIKALKDMVTQTSNRLDLFREKRVDNITDYNRVTSGNLRRKIIFIDEVAELLKTRDKALSGILYDCIETLTRLSRAAGIHLIMGIQRPDATIISGQIKNNVPFRVCGRFVDREPSQIMLGSDEASKLVNIKGRFIVKDDDIQEVQCFYYTDNHIHNLGIIPKATVTPNEIIPITEEEIIPDGEITIPVEAEISTPVPRSEPLSSDLDFDFSDIIK